MRHEAAEILGVRTREAEEAAAELQRQTDERVNELRAGAERYLEEQRLRAENEATGIVEAARTQGRDMVEEAKALRERVLADLARRRGLLQAQLEELRNGRDHLLDAYRVVKRTFLEATESLAQAEARAAAGKPLPSVDPSDVDAAIAAEAPSEEGAAVEVTDSTAATEPAEGAAVVVEVTEVVTDDAGHVVAVTEVAEVVEVEVAETTGDEHAMDEAEAPALADVDSLFARIRAGAEAPAPEEAPAATPGSDEPAGAGAAGEAAAGDAEATAPVEPEPAPAGDDERAAWRAQERSVVAPLVAPLVKQAKRAAQDEQNTLLDALRRHKGRPTAQQVLQSDLDTITAWSTVMRTALDAAYGAGRAAVGGDQVAAPPDLAEEAVRHVVMDLRDRLANAVDDDNDGYSTSLVIERIGARYREWKLQALEGLIEDVLTSAWSRGVFDAAPDGARLQWVAGEDGRCADCDDNALEPTVKGESFPTGQLHPPAHPGCRCILAVA
jgi:hypothetical protein